MTLTLNRDTYGNLLAQYLPKIIENDDENQQAIDLAQHLSHQHPRSPEETTLLNLLITLIEKYEQETYPIPDPQPHIILHELLEANNLQPTDLTALFPSEQTLIAILDGKQPITPEQAQKLAQNFHLDPSLFF